MLTIQVLDGQDVIPAEDEVLAELLVVGGHEGAPGGGVLQPQRVADLVRHHHEEVAPLAAAQGPALGAVEVGFSTAGEEGVGQGTSWGREGCQGAVGAARSPRCEPRAGGAWECLNRHRFCPSSRVPKGKPASRGYLCTHKTQTSCACRIGSGQGRLLGGHQHEPTTSIPTWELPRSGARTQDPPSPSLTAWAPR